MNGKAAKKRGRPVSGWIILDKPKGLFSTEAVSRVKWLYNAEKAGHAGTLDPLASGLLPIALGEATKTVPYVMDGVKSYQFTVVWGAERTTNDLEGEVIKVSHQRPTTEDIKALLPEYIGLILQTPPQYSAIRINGLHAYTLARSGKRVAIPPREVKINALDLIRITSEGHAVFEIECGKGTYIRSLARDMGYALGCYGYVADLRRFGVFPFTADDFITFAELEEACPSRSDFSLLDAFLLETSVALKSLPHYAIVDKKMADRICSGNPVFLHGRQQEKLREADRIYVRHKGRILAIGYISKGAFQPTRVF